MENLLKYRYDKYTSTGNDGIIEYIFKVIKDRMINPLGRNRKSIQLGLSSSCKHPVNGEKINTKQKYKNSNYDPVFIFFSF